MRYATSSQGESTFLLGKFVSGRLVSEVQMTLIDLATSATVALTSADCSEIVASAFGGVSTYKWPTANITTQPTSRVEYLYVMRDTVTGLTHEGKIVLGGYPNDVVISRKHIANRRRVDTTTTPWQEVVYDDDESAEIQRANLKDTAGANITNANKPSGTIVGERDPV